jgi:hypothetical protein
MPCQAKARSAKRFLNGSLKNKRPILELLAFVGFVGPPNDTAYRKDRLSLSAPFTRP